mgnify:CR=1 FL=1
MALPLAPGKVPLKIALQCILDSTAVYLDFHCSETKNGLKCVSNFFSKEKSVFLGKDWSFVREGLEFPSKRIGFHFVGKKKSLPEQDSNLSGRDF